MKLFDSRNSTNCSSLRKLFSFKLDPDLLQKIFPLADHAHFEDMQTHFNKISFQSDQRQFPEIHALLSIQRKVKTKLFQFCFSKSF